MKNLFSNRKNDRYFRTDHLKTDLKSRSVRGGAVTMVAQGLKLSLNLGSNVVLARLLTPQDYGLIGMVTAVTGFVALFKDLGLSMATIQKDEINHTQVSTLFWVNVVLSVITALFVVAIAPSIAWLYHEPRLIWITVALSVGFIFSGLGVQHSALLNRQMQYKVLMFNDVFSMLFGIVAAIVAAAYALGYWALVILPLVMAAVNTIGVWLACPWRPSLPTWRAGVRSMLVFGGNLTAFSTINYFARNLDNILIGRSWGSQQLGLYAKAYQLLLLPISQINTPIAAVAIPMLSRLQQEQQQFHRYYLKAVSIVAFLTMPIIGFMIVASEEIIELLLGSQWRDATVIFRLLCISALVQPVCNTSGWLYISTGRSNKMLQWGLLACPFIIGSFFVGLPYGATGVAYSYSIVMLLQALPCMYYATRQTTITLLDIAFNIGHSFLASLAAGIAVFGTKLVISSHLPMWITAAILSIIMAVSYLLIVFFFFNKKDFYLSVLSSLKSQRI
ncbi:Lipopolysaccharide biosynthesis protein [Nostoc sp. DSM 114161]|jgi:O-antigen/teichoic acid export membrane protein|uniref:lipopolysaccharide biosynthesis protein n=1 Tax=Nostoc sp. DSM 114161 TaxID=3440143 RepID=UPI0040457E59